MKIALCLSGQPRNAIATSNRIKHTILDNNDVDVFLHSWYDSNDLNFHKYLLPFCTHHIHMKVMLLDVGILIVFQLECTN